MRRDPIVLRESSEAWRPVVGFEGLYEVSEFGRVRSLHWSPPRLLRCSPNPKGYRAVNLSGYYREVQRLVLSAFVGPCPAGCEASHLNGQRGDNRLVNLAWETHAENEHRKLEHGTLPVGDSHPSRTRPERLRRGDNHPARLHPGYLLRGDAHPARVHPERMARGERNASAKLTAELVGEIRAASKRGETSASLGRRHGVSRSAIALVVHGVTWRHVGEAAS